MSKLTKEQIDARTKKSSYITLGSKDHISKIVLQLKEIDQGVKVVLSSGYSINGDAQQVLDRGCMGFIQKPFNLTAISLKIREILDKK